MMKRHALAVGILVAGSIVLGGYAWLRAQGAASAGLATQDYIDIRHAYARYNNTIDDGDAEGWVAMWTVDGDFNGFKGRDELLRFARDYLDNGDGALRRHWINNLEIEALPGGASAWNYFMILDVSVTPPAVASTGRNHDTFVRTRDGWRFSSRTTYDSAGKLLQLTVDDAD